jgi:putative endonuclease
MPYHVYIVTNKPYGTLYIGVTNSIARRAYEHKNKLVKGFTKRYGLTMLVYTEEYSNINEAIAREKAMKFWNRDWKIDIINKANPEWNDLFEFMN